jgi:hypothetical protein
MPRETHLFQSAESGIRWWRTDSRLLVTVVWLVGIVAFFAVEEQYLRPGRQQAEAARTASISETQVQDSRLKSAEPGDSAIVIKEAAPSIIFTPVNSVHFQSAAPGAETSASVPPATAPPIRHSAPMHEQMVTPGNFEYIGAFRPPHITGTVRNFTFGGWAMAFHDGGDADGKSDGCPGSLFLTGHRQQDLVAEISIPRPFISASRSMDEIPVASVLQPLTDVTNGIRDYMTQGSSEPFQIGGLCVVGNRLHWTLYKYYNVQTVDYPSHGASSLKLSDPAPQGLWHLGPSNSGRSEWHSYKHAGYIFEIPPDQARQWWFGGRNLISGLQIATGLNIASHGPAMFAYSLPNGNAADDHDVDALPLLYNDLSRPAPGFIPSDRWTGGAWLTLNDKQTVIVTGRKSLGESYYGEARPDDCSSDKGFHGAPYEAQMRFYAPQALAASAAGKADPTTIQPWDVWDHNSPGGGFSQYLFPTCTQLLGGLAYDRRNNILYLAQINAGTTTDQPYEPLPVIHVFRIIP